MSADIPPFYAGEIARRVFVLAREGRKVIPMHFGQPTAGAPPSARAAACAAIANDALGYWESMALRERLARHYAETYGVAVEPERVLLASGASAALVATFAALFQHGDRIALVRPGYPAYRNTLLGLGLKPVEIECSAAQGYRLTAAMVAALDPAPAGLIVASPANPTGVMLEREELADIVRVCRERRIRLISDEIYHGVTYGKRATCALELEPHAIVINSFSKLYRMPGWRLGWLIAPADLAPKLSCYLTNFFLTPPSASQHAALAAFEDLEELRRSVQSYARNRAVLLETLPRLGIHDMAPPDGAFYIYANIGHLTNDSLGFCMRLVDDTGIGLAPGIDFDPANGHRFIRFSFAVSTLEVERAMELFGAWLAASRRS
jgi:aspartate/methionine/tyrosine aminotransferase